MSATPRLTQLIDKQDNFEIIRDQIAGILAIEIANQKAIAQGEGKDPDLFYFHTYTERSNPWALIEDSEGKIINEAPIVNVFFDNDITDSNSSTISDNQEFAGSFNIDCYGAKNAKEIEQGVHSPGDELSAREAQRIARLVRNILMFNEYAYLGLKGVVTSRNISQRAMFQPIPGAASNNISICRLTVKVVYSEMALQTIPANLELAANQCLRKEDGLIYFDANFDYTQQGG